MRFMWFLWFLLVLVVLFAGYLFLVAPNPGARKKKLDAVLGWDYAHRGLFNNAGDNPENSLNAFAAAYEKGFGMELDVQMTRDDVLVVFHDDTLTRMCGIDKCLSEMSYEEIKEVKLLGSEQRIPTFDEMLQLVAGKTPLLVEIKTGPKTRVELLTQKTQARLDNYPYAYLIESFHPMCLNWYKKNAPGIVRGQLTFGPRKGNFLLGNLLGNVFSRPDFIAYNYTDDSCLSLRIIQRIFRPIMAAWTVRDAKTYRSIKDRYDVQIFEGEKTPN